MGIFLDWSVRYAVQREVSMTANPAFPVPIPNLVARHVFQSELHSRIL